jgi:DUF1680 family protein
MKPTRENLIILILTFMIYWGCGRDLDKNILEKGIQKTESAVDFSYQEVSVMFPSPASVKIATGGRFNQRYKGNVDYLHFLFDHYRHEMIYAFAERNYSPGKLLERMWDGEYAGKWLDAAIRTAVNTGDTTLIESIEAFVSSLINHQQPDGYIGIKPPTDRELNNWERDWDLWNQWNSMIGLLTHYEFLGNNGSLEAAKGIGDWIVNEYGPVNEENSRFINGETNVGFTNVVVIGQLIRLFKHTGNQRYLDFVSQVIEIYPPVQYMLDTGEPYLFHPYMLSAVLMGLADYASVKKDGNILAKVEQVWEILATAHMFPTGSLGEREDLDDNPIVDVPDGQLQETCATTEWIFFTMSLYEITGRIKYIEALEKTSYNALIGAQSKDGMKWCYWTPLRYSKHFLHGPTRCCFWSGPRGIARLPQMIYATRDNTVYVNFYESSKASLLTEKGELQVSQYSNFPEVGKSSIILKTPPDWEGKTCIRVPDWSTGFQARLNGDKISAGKDMDGYVNIDIQGSIEYHVEVQFEVPLIREYLDDDNLVIRRGPEVLSLDTRDNIDTWLGAADDLITIPDGIQFQPMESGRRYQWAGPVSGERRRYLVEVDDARTDELRGVVLTPYADAGNDGAAFRTAFPMTVKEDEEE